MAVAKNLSVTINLYKKYCLPVITWHKKHSWEQAIQIINTLGRNFLQLLFLQFVKCFFSDSEQKKPVI